MYTSLRAWKARQPDPDRSRGSHQGEVCTNISTSADTTPMGETGGRRSGREHGSTKPFPSSTHILDGSGLDANALYPNPTAYLHSLSSPKYQNHTMRLP